MLHSISDIEGYILQYIPISSATRFPGQEGILRTKEFLAFLGSPQNTLKVIHVAGTSGKGSTSFMISNFLEAQGYKVGLHLSPHLLDVRERTEINNELIEEQKYVSYFEEIVPVIEKMKNSKLGKITYFEILVGFAYYVFAREKVDYAVMETGLGGEFDGTNVVDRSDKLSIITKIGFDHMKILGHTLSQIAHQKAMICAEKGTLISIYQKPAVEKEIAAIVEKKNAHLFIIKKKTLHKIQIENNKTIFTFLWNNQIYKNFTISLLGVHQAENASLAIAALLYLGNRDGFLIKWDLIQKRAEHLRFKGRMDVILRENNTLILDGAHNVQKMNAFLKTVASISPHKKYTFVVAFKNDKEHMKILKYIISLANKIIVTTIFSEKQDLFHFSADPTYIRDALIHQGFTDVIIIKKIQEVMHAIHSSNDDVIVTGSLYLLGDIYKLL